MPNASLHLLHTFLVTPATTPTPASRKAWCLRHNVNTLVTQSPADALPKGWGGVGWGYALTFTWGENRTTGDSVAKASVAIYPGARARVFVRSHKVVVLLELPHRGTVKGAAPRPPPSAPATFRLDPLRPHAERRGRGV